MQINVPQDREWGHAAVKSAADTMQSAVIELPEGEWSEADLIAFADVLCGMLGLAKTKVPPEHAARVRIDNLLERCLRLREEVKIA